MSHRSEQEQKHTEAAKQKVTLYLPAELHRTLKIRAAVEMEPMSVLAEKALSFYLDHPELIEGAYGNTHRVHHCPACTHPFIVQSGQVQSLPNQSSSDVILDGSEADLVQADWGGSDEFPDNSKQDELVPC